MNGLVIMSAGSMVRLCRSCFWFLTLSMISSLQIHAQAQSLSSSTPQTTTKLQWIDLGKAVDTLDLQKKGYYFLNRMTLLGPKTIGFLDFRRESVLAFDFSSGLQQAYTEEWIYPLGEGAHQVGNLFDIQPSLEGVLLTDVVNRRVSEWSRKGEWTRNIDLENVTPSRLATCKDGSFYVLLENHHIKGMLAYVDSNHTLQSHFQRVSRFHESSIFHRDGALVCAQNNLVFGAFYFDYLRSYAPDGTLRWSRNLMGFEKNEKLLVQGENDLGRYFTINPKARRSIGNIHSVQNDLWVSFSGRSDGLMTRIDVYHSQTGEYIQSIKTQEVFSEFVVSSEGVFLHYVDEDSESTHVIRYELPSSYQYGASVWGNTSSNP